MKLCLLPMNKMKLSMKSHFERHIDICKLFSRKSSNKRPGRLFQINLGADAGRLFEGGRLFKFSQIVA